MGSDDFGMMFSYVGNIISMWESCEQDLAIIYQILCESENHAPYRSYGALVSANARFELIELAAKEYFGRPANLHQEVIAAIKLSREMAALRNKVAHAALVPSFKGRKLLWRTLPMPYQTRRYRDGEASYQFTESDLRGILGQIGDAYFHLHSLRGRLFAFDDRRHAQRARQRQAKVRKVRTPPQAWPRPPRSSPA